jgi:hypothetical protein
MIEVHGDHWRYNTDLDAATEKCPGGRPNNSRNVDGRMDFAVIHVSEAAIAHCVGEE